MDYVSETMQRQTMLWRGLFGTERGGEEAKRERERRGGSVSREREEVRRENVRERMTLRRERRVAQSQGAGESEREGERAEAAMTAEGERAERWEENALRRGDIGAAEPSGVRQDGSGERTMSTPAWRRGDGGDAAGESVTLLRQRTSARHAADTAQARELSRQFERDARRYDGGFIFY